MAFLSFKVDKKWGIVNEKGAVIASPRFDEVSLIKNLPQGVATSYFQTKIDGLLGLTPAAQGGTVESPAPVPLLPEAVAYLKPVDLEAF